VLYFYHVSGTDENAATFLDELTLAELRALFRAQLALLAARRDAGIPITASASVNLFRVACAQQKIHAANHAGAIICRKLRKGVR
jgi:hypothetical protein